MSMWSSAFNKGEKNMFTSKDVELPLSTFQNKNKLKRFKTKGNAHILFLSEG